MQISITGTPGNYWIFDGKYEHGPFNSVLDASWVSIDMVTDHINSLPGVSVVFFALEVN